MRIVLAYDADDAGRKGADRTGEKLARAGADVGIARLPEGSKDLTEAVVDGGMSQADLLAMIDAAEPYQTDGAVEAEPPRNHPYIETPSGLICRRRTEHGEIDEPLTNFTARIVSEVVEDDGAGERRLFEIEGRLRNRTARATFPPAVFASMSWVPELLGAGAVVEPGQMRRDRARAAIQHLSGEPPTRRVYLHTGWIETPAGWAYLHAGGAIGAQDPIEVRLPDPLANFRLPDAVGDYELVESTRSIIRLLDLAPYRITYPCLAAPHRAVIGAVDFTLFLVGPTGSFKTCLAALLQQMFGAAMDSRSLPANWDWTDNALERLAHHAKDALLIIDDYAPQGSPASVQRLHAKAERVLRAQANKSGRGRMGTGESVRAARAPRGLIGGTGEDLPQGASLMARILALDIAAGDIDGGRLTACQNDAARGLYAAHMARFIGWLAPRYSEIVAGLQAETEALRDQAQGLGLHRRTPTIAAGVAVGLRYLLQFAEDSGALSSSEADQHWERGWSAICEAAAAQSSHQASSEPTLRYFELLSSAIVSGRAHVENADGRAPQTMPQAWGWREAIFGAGVNERVDWRPEGPCIGWIDGPDLYLQPEAAFNVARSIGADTGDPLVLGMVTLHKRLRDRGLLLSIEDSQARLTVRKTLAGARQAVLHVEARRVVAIDRDGTDSWNDSGSDSGDLFQENGDNAVAFERASVAGGSFGTIGTIFRTDTDPRTGTGNGADRRRGSL